MKQQISLPPITLEHMNGLVTVTHSSGMRVAVGADRLRTWALGLLRKELTLGTDISDAHVAGADSTIGALDK